MRISLYKRPFVRQLCQRLFPTACLPDVGCVSGLFLHQVKSICGCEVCGVDDSQHAAQVARTAYGMEGFAGTLAEAGFPDQSFDAITAWRVLEHVPDPSRTLAGMPSLLKDGGCSILRVPNAASFNARVFRGNRYYWDCSLDLFIHSPETIERLRGLSGFRVDGITYDPGARWLADSLRSRLGDKRMALRSRAHPGGWGLVKRFLAPWTRLIAMAHRGDLIVIRTLREHRSPSRKARCRWFD